MMPNVMLTTEAWFIVSLLHYVQERVSRDTMLHGHMYIPYWPFQLTLYYATTLYKNRPIHIGYHTRILLSVAGRGKIDHASSTNRIDPFASRPPKLCDTNTPLCIFCSLRVKLLDNEQLVNIVSGKPIAYGWQRVEAPIKMNTRRLWLGKCVSLWKVIHKKVESLRAKREIGATSPTAFIITND